MKNSILSIAVFLILTSLILGCDDNNNSIDAAALTENNFVEDTAVRADPEEGVVVTFLEHPMSEDEGNDTGELGVDEVPYTYPETVEQTICWEDEDADATHYAELRNGEGSTILTIEANGECVNQVIEAGEYVMFIHHDQRIEDTFSIFLIPDQEDEEQVRETEELFNRFKKIVKSTLNSIDIALHEEARAQTVEEKIETLIKTNNCDGCNLMGAKFKKHEIR